jgi:NAD(P)-dependent dehydrogenase (short-subunit alcohol dehydrogenase family)
MSEIDDAAAEVEAFGRRALRHSVDVRSRESLDELCEAVTADFGRVDILINAAGYTFKEPRPTFPMANGRPSSMQT